MGKVNVRFLVVGLLVCSLVVLGTAMAQEEERDYFKVGVLTSLSGLYAKGGDVTKRGYDIGVAAINEMGGIEVKGEKYPIHLVYYDAQSDPATAAKVVERLITQEKVDFIFGTFASGVTLGAAPIVEKYQVPYLTGSAESPEIYRRGYKWVFGTIPTVPLIMKGPMKLIGEVLEPKPKSIVILGANEAFGKSIAEAVRDLAPQYGINILHYELYPRDLTDFTALITKVKPMKPDFLVVTGHLDNTIGATRAAKELNFNPKGYLMHSGPDHYDFVEALGKDAEYVFGPTPWDPIMEWNDPVFGTTAEFSTRFEDEYGHEPDYTEAACAATPVVFRAAVMQAGVTPPLSPEEKTSLRDTMWELNVETLFGPVAFAKAGDYPNNNTGLTSAAFQIQNGKRVLVGPSPETKVADPWYPTPPWDER